MEAGDVAWVFEVAVARVVNAAVRVSLVAAAVEVSIRVWVVAVEVAVVRVSVAAAIEVIFL